jgi:hypothetical protein
VISRLTIALTYYENPAMLQHQQAAIAGYPEHIRERVKLSVADDGSPEFPASDHAMEPNGYDFALFRIHKDIPWHHKAARNMAMHGADDGWCLITDIDHVLEADAAEALFASDLDPECYYIAGRRLPDGTPHHPHCNSYVMTKELYWRTGGCNEQWNYYGTDSIFRARIALFGKRVEMPDVKLTVYNLDGNDIGGIERAATRLPRKGSEYHARSHPEIKKALKTAHLQKPENVLGFEWSRVR